MAKKAKPVVEEVKPPPPKPAKSAQPPLRGKEGLRAPQIRILQALSKSKTPLNRAEIASQAPCDVASLTEQLGSLDEAKRLVNDVKHFPSLLSLGFVKSDTGESGVVYSITANGRKALEKAAGKEGRP